ALRHVVEPGRGEAALGKAGERRVEDLRRARLLAAAPAGRWGGRARAGGRGHVNNLLVGYLFVKPARTPRANPGLRRITPLIREESSTTERAAAARLGAGQGV